MPPPRLVIVKRRAKTAELERKRMTRVEELSMPMPPGFEGFMREIRALAHDEEPDYARLRAMARGWAGT